jgi:cell division protein FtsI/penicillin-binding protein 2
MDRARYGLFPPGSTFKVVTAMAALRKDPASAAQQYECRQLANGRVGNTVKGWGRLVRDDIMDRSPHGLLSMEPAMTVSCNAYFAQLAALRVGPQALLERRFWVSAWHRRRRSGICAKACPTPAMARARS